MIDPQVTIFLTPPEVAMFKDFQEYHATFTLLAQKGVFNIKNGKAIIHFDSNGYIQNIERQDSLYNSRIDNQAKTVL